MQLGLIVASTREGRLAPAVANWALERIEQHAAGDTANVLDLADLAGSTAAGDFDAAGRTRIREFAAQNSGYVVVTSEYNHGYPSALKAALDSVKHEWRGKPVGFVGYGGHGGGQRAVEQLRQVVAELHMVSVRDAVAIARAGRAFDDGVLDAAIDSVATDALVRMLGQIRWWSARDESPYPG